MMKQMSGHVCVGRLSTNLFNFKMYSAYRNISVFHLVFILFIISTNALNNIIYQRASYFDKYEGKRYDGAYTMRSQAKNRDACAVACLRDDTCNGVMVTSDGGVTECSFIGVVIEDSTSLAVDAGSTVFRKYYNVTSFLLDLAVTLYSLLDFFAVFCVLVL